MADPAFEDLFAKLEEKARKLEEGNLPLEDSLKVYEEGADLVDRLRAILDNAQLRIEKLQDRLGEDRLHLQEVEHEYDGDDE